MLSFGRMPESRGRFDGFSAAPFNEERYIIILRVNVCIFLQKTKLHHRKPEIENWK